MERTSLIEDPYKRAKFTSEICICTTYEVLADKFFKLLISRQSISFIEPSWYESIHKIYEIKKFGDVLSVFTKTFIKMKSFIQWYNFLYLYDK